MFCKIRERWRFGVKARVGWLDLDGRCTQISGTRGFVGFSKACETAKRGQDYIRTRVPVVIFLWVKYIDAMFVLRTTGSTVAAKAAPPLSSGATRVQAGHVRILV